MLDKNSVLAELKEIHREIGRASNKNLVKKELGKIFNLIRASIDRDYLIKYASEKMGLDKESMDTEGLSKRDWNSAINQMIDDNNKSHQGEDVIEVDPKDYDFFGFVFNKMKIKVGEKNAQHATSDVLIKVFLPGASKDIKKKKEKGQDSYEVEDYSKTELLEKAREMNKNGLIPHFRDVLKSKKHDDKYTIIKSFQLTAKNAISEWFSSTSLPFLPLKDQLNHPDIHWPKKDMTEDQKKEYLKENPKVKIRYKSWSDTDSRKNLENKGDEKEDKDSVVDEGVFAHGAEVFLNELKSEKLSKELKEFVTEEKKEGLISDPAYKYIKIKMEDPEMSNKEALLELKVIPEKGEGTEALRKVWKDILEEVKYSFARFAHSSEDKALVELLTLRDPNGTSFFPKDSNETYNPHQKHFVTKDSQIVLDILKKNYEKPYKEILRELRRNYPANLVSKIDKIQQYAKGLEGLKKIINEYANEGKSLNDFILDKKKKVIKKVESSTESIVDYLNELVRRLR